MKRTAWCFLPLMELLPHVSPTVRLPSLFLATMVIFVFFVCIRSQQSPTQSSPITADAFLPANSSDHLALLFIKASLLEGDQHGLASWNEGLHFCEWQGVTCGGRRHPQRVISLDLESLNLVGTLSPHIGNLSFLRRINLPHNQLHGHIPQELGGLVRLRYVGLSNNSLEGLVPSNLSRCLGLTVLDLGSNMLGGDIPTQLGLLLNLDWLVLGENNLTGEIPPDLGNLTSLTVLDLESNYLEGSIPNSLVGLCSLEYFLVSVNSLSGTIPSSIYNLSSLYNLDVGGNQLTGNLPADIGITLPKLHTLGLFDNEFVGPIPVSLANASRLGRLMLSTNMFSGPVPPNLGSLQNLSWVVLHRNRLENGDGNDWDFLNSLVNCSKLEILEIYDNMLTGELPAIIANFSSSLNWLTMGQNRIYGSLPAEIGNLVGLTIFTMDRNLLTGTVPVTIGQLKKLQNLDLFDNRITGQLPYSLGNLTSMNELIFSKNSLQGNIPASFGNFQSLEALNLAYNMLDGAIPKEVFGLSSLSLVLDLSHNSFVGSLPLEVGKLQNLKILNASDNKLSGEIPSTLGNCVLLEFLYLEGNSFRGDIPSSLSNLKGLQEIDLSRNNLSGPVPNFFENLQFLNYLNLSFNDLEGEVPNGGIFRDVNVSLILGNNKLCGDNPRFELHPCFVKDSEKGRINLTLEVVTLLIGGTTVCLIALCLLFFLLQSKKLSVGSLLKSSLSDQYVKISYAELFKATDGFSTANLVGEGSFGSVYKGTLEYNGQVVAVKVFNLQQLGASKSFMSECESFKSVRHKNLLKIVTSCSSVDFKGNDFRALIFKFMSNGSLEKWLHMDVNEDQDSMNNLNFTQRLNIAVDVATALNYLHNYGTRPIVHCDLKPSNVLLDDDMRAHLGDFGLARFLSAFADQPAGTSTSSIGLRGSIGYIAPEYGFNSQISIYGDVYSYGILLLEMFTGLRPTAEAFKDGLNLHIFAKMAFPDRVMEIVDIHMLLLDEEANRDASNIIQNCLVSIFKVGLMCSMDYPSDRMEMRDVCREMNAIRDAFLRM